ncbi:unnamed protein product, partial [Amoebophrya sp. A120]|eukprot:GSA120T00012307001.1
MQTTRSSKTFVILVITALPLALPLLVQPLLLQLVHRLYWSELQAREVRETEPAIMKEAASSSRETSCSASSTVHSGRLRCSQHNRSIASDLRNFMSTLSGSSARTARTQSSNASRGAAACVTKEVVRTQQVEDDLRISDDEAAGAAARARGGPPRYANDLRESYFAADGAAQQG